MTKKCGLVAASFFVAVVVMLAGCKKAGECPPAYGKGWVTAVEGPDWGYVNQNIPFTVSFWLSDPCWKFEKFEQMTRDSTTTTIQVISKKPEGCVVCPQVIAKGQATYNFMADRPGTYYLKFWKGENDYVTDTVTVMPK